MRAQILPITPEETFITQWREPFFIVCIINSDIMDALPIFLKLKHARALVVGGGDIAERKIDLLIRSGADVTVVSPSLGSQVHALFIAEKIQWIEDCF